MKKQITPTASPLPASKPEKEGKHTPGPWHTDTEYHDGLQFAVHSTNGSLIADIAKRVKIVGEDDEAIEKGWKFSKQEKANARLIAAAPDMLEVLTEMVDTIPSIYLHEENMPDFIKDIYIRAQKTIAKASK